MTRTAFLLLAALVALPISAARAQEPQSSSSVAAPFGDPVQDEHIYYHAILNEFEGRFGADTSLRWEGEAWGGTDANRLWLKSEGEASKGKLEDGQQELFYDRPISSYFDMQAGFRTDLDSRPGRKWAALGIEGLAPLFFHVSATGYASSEGHFAAKLEGDYDLLLTQRLILQPQAELNLYSKSDPAHLVGTGLSDLDAGLRLRYEFSRKFAPYIAMTYEKHSSSKLVPEGTAGQPNSELRAAFGLRLWL